MTTIIPAGGLTPDDPSEEQAEWPIPVSLIVEVLEELDYEVEQPRPGLIGARCRMKMPNLQVIVTPVGLDVRCWWNTNPLADRETVLEAINEANLHAKTWRYSIDGDGDLLVDRAILCTGEPRRETLKSIFFVGNMEMIMGISTHLDGVMG